MRYGTKLKLSFMQYWENKSLLSVLLLEFIARTIAIAAFIAIDIAVVMSINDVQLLASGMPDLQSFMNAKTYAVLAILFIIQFIAILYISSFFSAGFFGMLKNLIQDGSTTFDEFMPSAKRYWYQTFRYLLIPYLVMLVALLPFTYFYGVAGMVAVTGGIFSPEILTYLALSLLFALLVGMGVLFFLSYGPAIIVFDDEDAWSATKESAVLAKRRAWPTAVMVLSCMAITIAAFLIYHGINLSFTLLTQALRQQWMLVAARILELILQVITISAAVIAGIIIFQTYDEITTEKAARHAHTKKPEHAIRRKA